MSKHAFRALAFLAGAVLASSPGLRAQTSASAPMQGSGALPERAIRRTLPMTDMIRRAWAAGTRDASGRPGPDYWQLGVDYTIHATFDPGTARVTGRETAVIHNTSDSTLSSVHLRLDQNIFAPNVPRLETVPEITDGMPVTRLAFDGREVDLNPPPRRRFRGAGGQAQEVTLAAYGLGQTTAQITLPTPIPAHGSGTLEAEWSFKVPRSDNMRGLRMGSWADSLFQVAQWYPRVAVYDDLRDGRLGHGSVPRSVRVLQQLRQLRRDDRRPGGMDRGRDRRAARIPRRSSRPPRAIGCRTRSTSTRR